MHQSVRLTCAGYQAVKYTAPNASKAPIIAAAGPIQSRAIFSRSLSTARGLRSCGSSSSSSSKYTTASAKTLVFPSPCSAKTRALQQAVIYRLAQFRHASTASPAKQTASASPELDWETFFRLRISRRRFSLIASILSSLTTGAIAVNAVTTTPLSDAITNISPIPDPFVTLGVFTFFSAGLGWLIGPFFGQGVWKMMNRTSVKGFMAREKDFYERVKRYRVDPRGASAQNPVPDYYGERVGSRDQWRTWLKDQRAFNRKREGRGAEAGGALGFNRAK